MLQVDTAHFSNVVSSVQRTGSLAGGAIGGLPNGVVVAGLQGINSFGSDIAEAKREFELGRVRTALERVKQLENQFNGIASRWNATVGSLISSAKQGRQKLSLQKLNELKNAQVRMQQLTGPASKAFQDLVTALEHAVTREGRESEEATVETTADESTGQLDAPAAPPTPAPELPVEPSTEPPEQTPDADALGSFAANYRCGPKLQLRRGADNKTRIVPKLEIDKFYFLAGLEPPRVVRVRELQAKAVIVFDPHQARELLIEAQELTRLIKQGIWILV
jgi:hypothetical protein